jgi:hypothetical protein
MDELKKKSIHRKVTFLGYLAHHVSVEVIIPIVMILSYVKKPVGFNSEWLMYLKIKTDGSHDR